MPFHSLRNKVLNLTQQEAERLARGEVIQKAVNVNGEKTQQYLQLDPETKSVIHKRVTDIKLEQRLKDMEKVNDIELGMQQKQQVREGKPVELNVGGEKVSVGIDLKEQQGFRLIKGDMKEWERQQKLRYDEIHPEYLGLVMTDKNLKDMEKVNDIELGMQQKQQVREGKPVELNVGGEKVSVGIDLKEQQGFRLIKGDMKEWERQQKLRYDEIHPEYLGLVMTDKNRWEYQKVVDKQSVERAISLSPSRKETKANSLKL